MVKSPFQAISWPQASHHQGRGVFASVRTISQANIGPLFPAYG